MATAKVHRLTLCFGFIFLVLWASVNVLLATRFGFVSIDSVIYGLPLANARHVFDLGIPFLQNYTELGGSWGHQWPGSMWLKACFFLLVPYHVAWDFTLLYLAQAVAGALLGWMIWKVTRSAWLAWIAALFVLSDRVLLLCGAGQRPETIAILAVALLLFAARILVDKHKWWTAVIVAFAVISHPVVMIVAIALVFYWCWRAPFVLEANRNTTIALLVGLGAGLFIFISWLMFDLGARQQFWTNLQLQKSFYQHWNGVWTGLSNYRFGGGYVLWLLALGSTCHFLYRLLRGRIEPTSINRLHESLIVAWLIFLVVHTCSKCENFSYLSIGSFFAIGVVVLESHIIRQRCAVVALSCLALMHVVILPYRCVQYFRSGMPDYSQHLRQWVEGLPERQRVFFPHVLWPVALTQHQREWLWWTLPIASAQDGHRGYEKMAYARLRVGDLLIVDESMMAGEDKFGLQPQFPVIPPDVSRWRLIADFRSSVAGREDWGLHLRAYECVRVTNDLN